MALTALNKTSGHAVVHIAVRDNLNKKCPFLSLLKHTCLKMHTMSILIKACRTPQLPVCPSSQQNAPQLSYLRQWARCYHGDFMPSNWKTGLELIAILTEVWVMTLLAYNWGSFWADLWKPGTAQVLRSPAETFLLIHTQESGQREIERERTRERDTKCVHVRVCVH